MFDPAVARLMTALAGIAVVYALVGVLHRTIGRYIKDSDMRYRARKVSSFTGYAVGIMVVATVYSDRLGNWTVAFGMAGAGIAFALQEVIASVAGWVALSAGGFYSPGDRVQLGGIKGDVIDIGVLRTTLMEVGQWVNGDLYNGRIVRVANSFVFKEPVVNYSADFPFLWDEIVFPVRYGSDWKYARTMLNDVVQEVIGEYARQSTAAWQDVVKKYRIEDASVAPMITIKADQNWIEYTIRYVVDYRRRRTTRDILFTRILEEVDKSDGRIGIATAGFEVLSTPVVKVQLHRTEA
jgi:small-conductance mechanosensitive channel